MDAAMLRNKATLDAGYSSGQFRYNTVENKYKVRSVEFFVDAEFTIQSMSGYEYRLATLPQNYPYPTPIVTAIELMFPEYISTKANDFSGSGSTIVYLNSGVRLPYNQPWRIRTETLYIKEGHKLERQIPITVRVTGSNFEPVARLVSLFVDIDTRDYAEEARIQAEKNLVDAARDLQAAQKKYADVLDSAFSSERDKAAKRDEKKKKDAKAKSVEELKKTMLRNGMFSPSAGMPSKAVDACVEAIIDLFINNSGAEKKLSEIKMTLPKEIRAGCAPKRLKKPGGRATVHRLSRRMSWFCQRL